MKYLLFAGERFYPVGGFKDYIDVFNSVEEAKHKLAEMCEGGKELDAYYFWAHIVDSTTFKIICEIDGSDKIWDLLT